jgi:hypothetical protein
MTDTSAPTDVTVTLPVPSSVAIVGDVTRTGVTGGRMPRAPWTNIITTGRANTDDNYVQVKNEEWQDMARLVERMMVDSTTLITKFDLSYTGENLPAMAISQEMMRTVGNSEKTSTEDAGKMVPVISVMRVASVIVGALSIFALIGFFLSGAVIIQPFVAVLLVVASIGFYIMSFLKPAVHDG